MHLPLIVSSLFALATLTVHAEQSNKSLTKRFNRLDLNGDAAVDAGEFAKLLPAKLTQNNALVQTQSAMFAWFDEDASEGIDLSEWLEAMSGGNSGSPDFSAEVVDELDTNHDGNLTWKEFNRVIKSYVSSKTSRGWFSAISSASSAGSSMHVMSRAAFSVTNYSGTGTVVGPRGTVSEEVLPVAGPREVVMTTGGDCFAPAPSTSE